MDLWVENHLKSLFRKKVKPAASARAYLKLIQPQQSWGIITESAEGSGKGGCKGDSGGPFFCTMWVLRKWYFFSLWNFHFSNGVRKQFGVASFADMKCGSTTGWYKPSAVLSWIKQNSKYGSGSSGSSSTSSSSYSQPSSNNRYQSSSYNQQNSYNNQNRYYQQNSYNQQNQQRSTTSHNANSGSSQKAAQVKKELLQFNKELQKLQTQMSQIIALL